jgi:hypothetical protein
MAMGADGTSYDVNRRADGTYEIVATKLEGMPHVVKLFATQAEAEHWILEQVEANGGDLPDVITYPEDRAH